MEILGGPDVPRASQVGCPATKRHLKIQRISLTVFRFSSKRAIGFFGRQQQLIAQPPGIVSGKSERGGEHTGLVFAFFVDGGERVVAKFCNVHESVFGVGRLHGA